MLTLQMSESTSKALSAVFVVLAWGSLPLKLTAALMLVTMIVVMAKGDIHLVWSDLFFNATHLMSNLLMSLLSKSWVLVSRPVLLILVVTGYVADWVMVTSE